MGKTKNYIIWSIIIVVVIIVLLFSLKGCAIGVSENDIKSDIKDSLINIIGDRIADDDGHTVEEVFSEELVISLEPLNDEECVIDNLGCMEGCFELLEPCLEDVYDCADVCDETFPITDEINECWDGCYDNNVECEDDCDAMYLSSDTSFELEEFLTMVPAVYAIAPMDDEYDNCEADCHDIWNECDNDCDSEYLDCADDCIYLIDPCLESTVDCIYECLIPCISGEESMIWDGTPVTDVGNFYETYFPNFDGQFENICGWLIMGDFVSNEDKYGCEDIGFIGDWFAPYMNSIESMQNVCETIDGTFIINDDEISCNI